MPNVSVEVLQNFGEHLVGEVVEVPGSRLPFLLARKLAKVTTDPVTSSTSPPDPEDAIDAPVEVSQPISPSEPEQEIAAQPGVGAQTHLSPETSADPPQEDEPVNPNLIFHMYLQGKFDGSPALDQIIEKYPSPDELREASVAELMLIPGVGNALGMRLKRAADDYRPGQFDD